MVAGKRIRMTGVTLEKRPLTMSGKELYPTLFPDVPCREMIHCDSMNTLILKKYVREYRHYCARIIAQQERRGRAGSRPPAIPRAAPPRGG